MNKRARMQLLAGEVNELLKARDLSKLVKKTVTNKRGKRQTVWVKPAQSEDTKREQKSSPKMKWNQPLAGETVSGLKVRSEVPNLASIGATLENAEELEGIREISMSDMETADPRDLFHAADDLARTRELSEAIKQSGEINPLIVVYDHEDRPYVLEGGHRLGALHLLGARSFPAKVVVDVDDIVNNSPVPDSLKDLNHEINRNFSEQGVRGVITGRYLSAKKPRENSWGHVLSYALKNAVKTGRVQAATVVYRAGPTIMTSYMSNEMKNSMRLQGGYAVAPNGIVYSIKSGSVKKARALDELERTVALLKARLEKAQRRNVGEVWTRPSGQRVIKLDRNKIVPYREEKHGKPGKKEEKEEKQTEPKISDEDWRSENYRFRDTGHIPGARKEDAASIIRRYKREKRRVLITDIDWANLEENPREAEKLIVKSNLFGQTDWESLQKDGMTSAAGFLVDRIYASLPTAPDEQNEESRFRYAKALQTVRERAEKARTVEDVKSFLDEIYGELTGIQLTEEDERMMTDLNSRLKELYREEREGLDRLKPLYDAYTRTGWKKFELDRFIENRRKRGWKVKDEDIENLRQLSKEYDEQKDEYYEMNTKRLERMEVIDKQTENMRRQRDLLHKAGRLRHKQSDIYRTWKALEGKGSKFFSVVNYQSRQGSDAFRKHLTAARLGKHDNWEWTKKETSRTPRVRKSEVNFQLRVAETFERVGGRDIKVDSTTSLKNTFGLRDVQSGNWVLKDRAAAAFHVQKSAEAFTDMADLLGMKDTNVSLNGELAMAFGARGKGAAGAVAGTTTAHYEPKHRVINMTKMGGGGGLAHEWFHAVDNLLGSFQAEKQGTPMHWEQFSTENPDSLPRGRYQDALKNLNNAINRGSVAETADYHYSSKDYRLAQANMGRKHRITDLIRENTLHVAIEAIREMHGMNKVAKRSELKGKDWETKMARKNWDQGSRWIEIAIAHNGGDPNGGVVRTETGNMISNFLEEARKLAPSHYWSSRSEMAARAFSAYIEDKMSTSARRNDYLSSGSDNALYVLLEQKPFPEGEERTRINNAFDEFFAAVREESILQKALAKAKPVPVGSLSPDGTRRKVAEGRWEPVKKREKGEDKQDGKTARIKMKTAVIASLKENLKKLIKNLLEGATRGAGEGLRGGGAEAVGETAARTEVRAVKKPKKVKDKKKEVVEKAGEIIELLKARAFAEGTVREWKGVKHVKRGKKWHPVRETGTSERIAEGMLSRAVRENIRDSLESRIGALKDKKFPEARELEKEAREELEKLQPDSAEKNLDRLLEGRDRQASAVAAAEEIGKIRSSVAYRKLTAKIAETARDLKEADEEDREDLNYEIRELQLKRNSLVARKVEDARIRADLAALNDLELDRLTEAARDAAGSSPPGPPLSIRMDKPLGELIADKKRHSARAFRVLRKRLGKSLTWSGHKLQGRQKFRGLDISIENRAGSVRSGTDPDGKEWKTKMKIPYGYIRGTVGADGDHLDCFLGPDESAENVTVISLKNPDGSFDEDKAMLGFPSEERAVAAWRDHYDDPERYFLASFSVPFERFEKMIEKPGRLAKALVLGRAAFIVGSLEELMKAKRRNVNEIWTQPSGRKVIKIAPKKIVPYNEEKHGHLGKKDDEQKDDPFRTAVRALSAMKISELIDKKSDTDPASMTLSQIDEEMSLLDKTGDRLYADFVKLVQLPKNVNSSAYILAHADDVNVKVYKSARRRIAGRRGALKSEKSRREAPIPRRESKANVALQEKHHAELKEAYYRALDAEFENLDDETREDILAGRAAAVGSFLFDKGKIFAHSKEVGKIPSDLVKRLRFAVLAPTGGSPSNMRGDARKILSAVGKGEDWKMDPSKLNLVNARALAPYKYQSPPTEPGEAHLEPSMRLSSSNHATETDKYFTDQAALVAKDAVKEPALFEKWKSDARAVGAYERDAEPFNRDVLKFFLAAPSEPATAVESYQYPSGEGRLRLSDGRAVRSVDPGRHAMIKKMTGADETRMGETGTVYHAGGRPVAALAYLATDEKDGELAKKGSPESVKKAMDEVIDLLKAKAAPLYSTSTHQKGGKAVKVIKVPAAGARKTQWVPFNEKEHGHLKPGMARKEPPDRHQEDLRKYARLKERFDELNLELMRGAHAVDPKTGNVRKVNDDGTGFGPGEGISFSEFRKDQMDEMKSDSMRERMNAAELARTFKEEWGDMIETVAAHKEMAALREKLRGPELPFPKPEKPAPRKPEKKPGIIKKPAPEKKAPAVKQAPAKKKELVPFARKGYRAEVDEGGLILGTRFVLNAPDGSEIGSAYSKAEAARKIDEHARKLKEHVEGTEYGGYVIKRMKPPEDASEGVLVFKDGKEITKPHGQTEVRAYFENPTEAKKFLDAKIKEDEEARKRRAERKAAEERERIESARAGTRDIGQTVPEDYSPDSKEAKKYEKERLDAVKAHVAEKIKNVNLPAFTETRAYLEDVNMVLERGGGTYSVIAQREEVFSTSSENSVKAFIALMKDLGIKGDRDVSASQRKKEAARLRGLGRNLMKGNYPTNEMDRKLTKPGISHLKTSWKFVEKGDPRMPRSGLLQTPTVLSDSRMAVNVSDSNSAELERWKKKAGLVDKETNVAADNALKPVRGMKQSSLSSYQRPDGVGEAIVHGPDGQEYRMSADRVAALQKLTGFDAVAVPSGETYSYLGRSKATSVPVLLLKNNRPVGALMGNPYETRIDQD